MKTLKICLFALALAVIPARLATAADSAVQAKPGEPQAIQKTSSCGAEIMILENDFENTALFNASAANMIGEYNRAGRWGIFSTKGPLVTTEKAHSGKQAVKLIRGGGDLLGYGEGATGLDYEVVFWVHRPSDGSFSVFLSSVNNKEICGIYIWPTPEGEIFLYNFAAAKWTPTKTNVPPDQWIKIKIVSDSANKKYGAVAQSGQTPDTWEKLNSGDGVRSIKFTPAAPDKKVSCYIDDIAVIQK
ncbi:MAG: hypothetical protein WCV67_00240 [Victivallaceae bacterium]|jgi:hypothetical protein